MSGQARAEYRRKRRIDRKVPDLDNLTEDWGILVGWCESEEQLFRAKASLGRQVEDGMGDRRTGEVRFLWCDGDQAASILEKIKTRDDACEETARNHYRRLSRLLDENGGFIVVAMAPGDRT